MSSGKSKVQDALTNLAARLKLESLELNEKNEAYLLFDQQFHTTCIFNEEKDEFALYSIVGTLEKGSFNAYKKLLGDNFFWVGTAGAKLLIEPADGDSPDIIVLKETVPLAMFDEERLYERMEDFVNAVEYWTTEYTKLQQGGGTSSVGVLSDAAPVSDFMMSA